MPPPANWKCTCHGETVQELETERALIDQVKASQAQRKNEYDLRMAAAEAMDVNSPDLATQRDQLVYRNAAITAARDAIIDLTLDKVALNNRTAQWVLCWGNLSPPN